MVDLNTFMRILGMLTVEDMERLAGNGVRVEISSGRITGFELEDAE